MRLFVFSLCRAVIDYIFLPPGSTWIFHEAEGNSIKCEKKQHHFSLFHLHLFFI
jgi:hypothetical protein